MLFHSRLYKNAKSLSQGGHNLIAIIKFPNLHHFLLSQKVLDINNYCQVLLSMCMYVCTFYIFSSIISAEFTSNISW